MVMLCKLTFCECTYVEVYLPSSPLSPISLFRLPTTFCLPFFLRVSLESTTSTDAAPCYHVELHMYAEPAPLFISTSLFPITDDVATSLCTDGPPPLLNVSDRPFIVDNSVPTRHTCDWAVYL